MAIHEIVICQVPMQHPDIRNILKQVRESGATSVQIYTFWKDFEPEKEGVFDWSYFDAQVALLKEAGLRWVPFLLIGPKYAAPEWWLRDPRHEGLVCLEHGKTSPIDSIWSTGIREQVRRVVRAFAAHYLPMGIIESIQPGICGDYGEAIMPVRGNWAGDYHTHMGFWCGDRHAVVSYREAMRAKYGEIGALNAAQNAHYASFDEIVPVLPHKATSRTALFDQDAWYKDSMTEFADFWLGVCRENFPETPIYLCTGGHEEPGQASDFAAQAKVCAKYGAGLRLTNECNRFSENFFLTAYTHAACEFYGAYLGLEPVGGLTPEGVNARLFGSAVYGNRQLMFYYYNLFRSEADADGKYGTACSEAFSAHLGLLEERKTKSEVAFFWQGHMGTLGDGIPGGIRPVVSYLRSVTDLMPLNERMIRDGALDRFKLFLIPQGGFTDRETLACIERYVRNGGVVFAIGQMKDLELENVDSYNELFGILPDSDIGIGGAYFKVRTPDRFPGLAEKGGYEAESGWLGLHPETVSVTKCDFDPNNYSGTTTAEMSNLFLREYPSENGRTGAAIAYFGPTDFLYDPQSITSASRMPVFSLILSDVLKRYTSAEELFTSPEEQARGYIGDRLFVLKKDGRILEAEKPSAGK